MKKQIETFSTVTAEMKYYDRVRGWLKGRTEDYEFHASQMEARLE